MEHGHQPGLVGVVAQDTARFSMFGASLSALEMPDGTSVKWWFGHDIADNCNALVREMYEQEKDWMWLLGDDHSFSPQLLMLLLDREVDIVVPLCLQRTQPYQPVIYSGVREDGYRTIVNLDEHEGGIIPVHSCGSGGMLIRRRVFDELQDPWFESRVVSNVSLAEDVYFCDKAREKGVEIYCDLDARLGHCTTGVVWPVAEHDGWTVGMSFMGGFQLVLPVGTFR